jgi:glutamate 5-kinase
VARRRAGAEAGRNQRRRRGQGARQWQEPAAGGGERVEEAFARGDCVAIRDESGVEIGRGLSACDAERAERIRGGNSRDIAQILGFAGRAEMIHRDDMALAKRR